VILPQALAGVVRDLQGALHACALAECMVAQLSLGPASGTPEGQRQAKRALSLSYDGLSVCARLLHPKNLQLGALHHDAGKVAAAAAALGAASHRTAAELFRCSYSTLAHHYPPSSPQLAFELALVGACEELAEGLSRSESTQQAEHIIYLHFGLEGVSAARAYCKQQLG